MEDDRALDWREDGTGLEAEDTCGSCRWCILPDPEEFPGARIGWCTQARDFVDPDKEAECTW